MRPSQPVVSTYHFRRARVPLAVLDPVVARAAADDPTEPTGLVDIAVATDRIVAVTPTAAAATPPDAPVTTIDLAGGLTWPGWVDVHTHLDKAHTWDRAPNPRHEFWEAIRILGADRKFWTAEDLHRRATRALQAAWQHGTTAIRTHLDCSPEQVEISFPVLAELQREWAGRMTLQTVALFGLDQIVTPEGERMVRRAADLGATALGGMPVMGPDVDRHLDRLFAVAGELGLPVDLHVDENLDASTETVRRTAMAAQKASFALPIACGHACSLALHEPERQRETLAILKDLDLTLISLPLCNAYLQDRRWAEPLVPGGAPRGRTPIYRGLTLLHEALETGVRVCCASDNVRDAFYAYGDLDPWEVFVAAVRAGHLDSRLDTAPAVVTRHPADLMGLPDYGRIAVGARATLVSFAAPTLNELLARPWQERRVWDGGVLREAERERLG